MAAIFISHSSADNKVAAEMKAWLEAQGHTSLFLDFDPEAGIKGGSGWEQTLYQQLRQCQAVIALLTPNWLASKWCFAELVQARERGKAVFPVKVQPCEAGSVLSDIQHIDLTAQPEEGYNRLRIGLLKWGLDPTDVFIWDSKRPPYPGLMAFQEADAAIFFGRGEEILKTLETLDALRRQGREAARFVLMLGASGSGKSSLARAGVIPRLKKTPGEWLPAPPFRPQVEPLDEMAMALAAAFEIHGKPRDWSAIRTELHAAAQSPAGAQVLLKLVRDLAIAARQPDTMLLLTIDQAEELFGYTPSEAATRFLRLLRAALEAADRRLMAVATLRSDFLGEFQNHPVLQDSEYQHHFRYRAVPVDPMPLRNFPEIIQGPARLAGLQLDEGVVEAMVNDTGTRDALPLLAFILRRLYERFGGDGRLTVGDYESLGRLEGAIREEAERVIAESNPTLEDLDALHAAFVPAMVRINTEGGYARRRALFDDLPRRALPLLRRFVDARLLVTDRNAEGQETIEVAHEALLRTWPQLGAWLAEDQDKLRLLESLQRSAEEWDENGRRDDLLIHRNSRLKEAEALLGNPRFTVPGSSVERTYLNACRMAQQAREAAEREEQERRVRDAERIAEEQKRAAMAQKRTAQATLIGLAVAVLVAGLAIWQFVEAKNQQQASELEAQRANAGRLAIAAEQEKDRNFDLALLLANEAIRATESPPTLEVQDLMLTALVTHSQLVKTLHGHGGSVRDVAFSPDGTKLASVSEDGTGRIWDTDTGQALGMLVGHNGIVKTVAFSPDGKQVVTASEDMTVRLWDTQPIAGELKTVRIWDADNGQLLSAPKVIDESQVDAGFSGMFVCCAIFTPDGKRLVAAGWTPIQFWDVETGKLLDTPRPKGGDLVRDMAFSPDGKRLALAGIMTGIQLSNTDDGEPVGIKFEGQTSVVSIVFSPDGKRLASASSDKTVMLWNAENGTAIIVLPQDHPVTHVAFSSDGKLLASTSGDIRDDVHGASGSLRLWDVEDDRLLDNASLKGHNGPVLSVAFSPDGKRLASAGGDKTVRLWDTEERLPLGIRIKTDDAIDLAFTSDGKRLITVGKDHTLRLWDAANGSSLATFSKRGKHDFKDVLFSPDGKRFATVDNNTVRLWDTENGQPIGKPLHHDKEISNVFYSFDGKRLATATSDNTIRLWDADGRPLGGPIQQDNEVNSVVFSPNGKHFISASRDHSVRLCDAESGKLVVELLKAQKNQTNVYVHGKGNVDLLSVFSPNGKHLALLSDNQTLRLWDVERIHLLDYSLRQSEGVSSIAFSPDGKRLASMSGLRSMSDYATVRLWDTENGSPIGEPIKEQGGTSMAFSHDGKLLATASGTQIHLWDARSRKPIGVKIGYTYGIEANTHVVFSPGGKRLAWLRNGMLMLLDLDASSWQRRACAIANRNLTREEWRKYMGDQPYRKTCPNLPGPDDTPEVMTAQAAPGTNKPQSVEPAPAFSAPPVIQPQPENSLVPKPSPSSSNHDAKP